MSLDTLTVTNNRISNLPTAILLFVIGFGGRIMLHDYPNFETVMVSIFLASMLLPLSMSFVVTISIIFLSDLYLGYFGTSKIIIFTYSGFLLVSLITSRFKDQIKGNYNSNTVYKFSATGIIFAGIYDVWTNFGVFLLSYELTLENLILVYILAITGRYNPKVGDKIIAVCAETGPSIWRMNIGCAPKPQGLELRELRQYHLLL